jgi:hypothetical protein
MMGCDYPTKNELERALSLGNLNIQFKFILKTTHLKDGGNNRWALTDESVVLKGSWNSINRF